MRRWLHCGHRWQAVSQGKLTNISSTLYSLCNLPFSLYLSLPCADSTWCPDLVTTDESPRRLRLRQWHRRWRWRIGFHSARTLCQGSVSSSALTHTHSDTYIYIYINLATLQPLMNSIHGTKRHIRSPNIVARSRARYTKITQVSLSARMP